MRKKLCVEPSALNPPFSKGEEMMHVFVLNIFGEKLYGN